MAESRKKKPKSVAVRMVIAPNAYAYLSFLSKHTILGGSENDVAAFLLTERLQAMMKQRYHETELPPPEDDVDA